MRKLVWAALAVTFLATASFAQKTPIADASVGYTMLHLNGSGGAAGVSLNGVSGSLSYNASSWLGIVGDFGVYHGSPSGVGMTASTYTFGPRISFRTNDRFVPYAQALFGGAHISASVAGISASSNPFAYGFGGGADLNILGGGRVGLRPQFEYFGLRSNGSTENSFRLSVGIVYHIGSK